MEKHGCLAARFMWARVLVRCLVQLLGSNHVQRTLLCQCQGTDTDFSGGAAAWEQAAAMLEAAGAESGLEFQLKPRSICEPWLRLTFVSLYQVVTCDPIRPNCAYNSFWTCLFSQGWQGYDHVLIVFCNA